MDKDIDEDIAVRYSGHRALCEIDLPGQRAIERGRVLVVGAGGLGSPVCLYLAAAGVGTIGIVDADTVSLSNLQRQIIHHTSDIGRPKVESAAVKMKAINPHVNVVTVGEMLTSRNSSSLVEGYDIVVDCTDNFDTRLLVNDTCVALGTPMVYGAVQRMAGQIFTYLPGGADYRAWFGCRPPSQEQPCSVNGVMNTVVGVIGTLQATEVIKYLSHAGDLLDCRLLMFDAVTMTFRTIKSSVRSGR
ncbi:HesA/MoeB/ThiF family protein [Muribaculum intestinale]|uniref:HesA/MoeB/ThiF family protein n=1 Tax=Muribaculum intestinale TaxID=1796646 RepID=UPI000A77DC80|nr:HesA/MoeB/ThiF family protein [Muribaculum intestinale]PWB04586.1 HesA/MoeB/ThiF family protein [Muribaculum intestinale]PWB12421.1 HesA/MoeB/ThiF family protein [Muribaculum intestinale]QQR07867.1 HesA/MoeB/ThiF family protein [Muribaculum intestinale]